MRRLPTAVIALTLTAAAGLVPAAQATFPGRNGGIAFEQRSSSGDSGPNVEHSRLATRPPGSAGFRTLLDCELTDGVPSGGDCTGTSYRSPSYSSDGRIAHVRRRNADRDHRR